MATPAQKLGDLLWRAQQPQQGGALSSGFRNPFSGADNPAQAYPAPPDLSLREYMEIAAMTQVPGVADVASGGLSLSDLMRGDYGSAALNGLGALPLVPAMGLGIKQIKTEKALEDIVRSAGDNVYVRWSRGPKFDKKMGGSRDFVSGQDHKGLSAVPVDADWASDAERMSRRLGEYGFLRMKDAMISPYLYRASRVGTDSDGYALISDINAIARIDPALLDAMKAKYRK